VEVHGVADAVSLFSGGRHTCAVRRQGGLTCWGNSARGQLDMVGPGGETPRSLEAMTDIVAGSGGGDATCAIHASGGVICWGPRLPSLRSYPPTEVNGATDAVSVAAAEDHGCLVQRSGQVWCWGRNTWGQLGDGSTVDSSMTAVQAKGISNAVKVTAVPGRSCALLATGEVWCWGHPEGQLFDPARHPLASRVPVPIAKL